LWRVAGTRRAVTAGPAVEPTRRAGWRPLVLPGRGAAALSTHASPCRGTCACAAASGCRTAARAEGAAARRCRPIARPVDSRVRGPAARYPPRAPPPPRVRAARDWATRGWGSRAPRERRRRGLVGPPRVRTAPPPRGRARRPGGPPLPPTTSLACRAATAAPRVRAGPRARRVRNRVLAPRRVGNHALAPRWVTAGRAAARCAGPPSTGARGEAASKLGERVGGGGGGRAPRARLGRRARPAASGSRQLGPPAGDDGSNDPGAAAAAPRAPGGAPPPLPLSLGSRFAVDPQPPPSPPPVGGADGARRGAFASPPGRRPLLDRHP